MRLGEIGRIGDAQVRREDDPGQVALVGPLVRQALSRLGRVRPQAHRTLGIGEEHRERRAPGARTEDPDLVGHAREDISVWSVIPRPSRSHPPPMLSAATTSPIRIRPGSVTHHPVSALYANPTPAKASGARLTTIASHATPRTPVRRAWARPKPSTSADSPISPMTKTSQPA